MTDIGAIDTVPNAFGDHSDMAVLILHQMD